MNPTEPRFANSGLHRGPLDEGSLIAQVEACRHELHGAQADLALVFITPALASRASDILEIIQVHARARLLAGCSGTGVIADGSEVEEGPALAFALISVPGARFSAHPFSSAEVDTPGGPTAWYERTGISRSLTRGWLAFADPFSLDAEAWLRQWNDAYPGVPTIGGLAGSAPGDQNTLLFHNQSIYTEGGLALCVAGSVGLETLVSQGCRPIGRPWTITAADRNLIRKIGNLPALSVLQDTFENLPADDKARAGGNIFVGLAVNEYQEEHRRGDFLIRNLLAADPQSGTVAVGAKVRVGQTLQFQFRDGATAKEDLTSVLEGAQARLKGRLLHAACLCSCAGRGARLFGQPNHDAQIIREGFTPSPPLAGFFCNGEFGPVSGRNYVHGYTASAALFISDAPV